MRQAYWPSGRTRHMVIVVVTPLAAPAECGFDQAVWHTSAVGRRWIRVAAEESYG